MKYLFLKFLKILGENGGISQLTQKLQKGQNVIFAKSGYEIQNEEVQLPYTKVKSK